MNLTPFQRTAINRAIQSMSDPNFRHSTLEREAVVTLRKMLRDSDKTWIVTDARIRALERGAGLLLRYGTDKTDENEIREMLREQYI